MYSIAKRGNNRPHGSLYGARKLLHPSLFLLYFEMLACMSISLSLTTAFTLLRCIYVYYYFYRIRMYFVKMESK